MFCNFYGGFNLWTWLLVNAGWCSLYRCFFNVLHVSWCFILFLLYIRKGCMCLCFFWLLNVTPILILFTTASFLWDKESRAIFTFIPMYFCFNSPRGQQRASFPPWNYIAITLGNITMETCFLSRMNDWVCSVSSYIYFLRSVCSSTRKEPEGQSGLSQLNFSCIILREAS